MRAVQDASSGSKGLQFFRSKEDVLLHLERMRKIPLAPLHWRGPGGEHITVRPYWIPGFVVQVADRPTPGGWTVEVLEIETGRRRLF